MTRRSLNLMVTFAIAGAGLLISLIFVWTAPETQPEEKVAVTKIVRTMQVTPGNQAIVLETQGTVIPARRVEMVPQVKGRVVEQNDELVPGGTLRAGDPLIRIDPSDYELALTEQQTALAEATFELEVERGRQVVASREWKLLESELADSDANPSLVLREPHLRRTEALIRKATNEIAKAALDLSRTSIRVPFNSVVLDETVEIGQVIEPGNSICTLVGTDEFWVQTTISLEKLKWIRLPTADALGSPARVILETGRNSNSWEGTVFRLLGDLEPVGRMARVLVRIADPLQLQSGETRNPLLLGSYVRVEIETGELSDVLTIPESAVREGGRIWTVNRDHELVIKSIEILWTQRDRVTIKNCVEPGEQLIVSNLRTALPGMKVDPQPVEAVSAGESSGP
jgi:RND family efflux transporter MFP subunit